jgi:uncharacterized protein (AIM24 family)
MEKKRLKGKLENDSRIINKLKGNKIVKIFFLTGYPGRLERILTNFIYFKINNYINF